MEHDRCGQCGARIDAGSPGGLCPPCLLVLGMEPPSAPGTRRASQGAAPQIPERIGVYRILDLLGEGGMGIVYLAEQTEPIQRRVAIKVIKPGADSREVLARFDAERQALAIMNHPNVAKVFDAGATDQGRPYVVMEYVPGVPVTDYCDMHCLPIRGRLELFTTACGAIQHAHQKGIIHRDIKPSNVLVSSEDGKPVLKVIDFGVAKATGQPLTGRTLFTRQGVLLGTPEYMSPEQAGTTALDVDARTDIYSLGVILYELLVGALPLDGAALQRAAVVEMMRIIREEDPPTPTTKFSSLGATASEVARRRDSDVRSLARQVHGELEWIAMRALEKDPGRRYQSASELAADIQRHLADEPVVARPASRSYLLRKFARKHRPVVAALAASFVVLLAGVVVSTALYHRSEAARARAEMEAVRSGLEADALQAALRMDAEAYSSLSERAMDLHRRALGPDSPALAPYLVNQLLISEVAFNGRLRSKGTAASVRKAAELVERGLDAGDTSAVKTLLLLPEVLEGGQDYMQRLYAKAFELVRREESGQGRGAPERLDLVADLLENGPPELASPKGPGSAERIAREVLAFRREAHPSGAPQLTFSLARLAGLLSVKGGGSRARGDAESAAAAYREALSLVGETGPDSAVRAAEIESDLGMCLMSLGRLAEAEPLLTRSHGVLDVQKGGRFATTQLALNRLVDLYTAWGRPGDAARHLGMLRPISIGDVRDLGRVAFVPGAVQRNGGISTSIDGRPVWIFTEMITAALGEAWRRTDSSWGLAALGASGDGPTVTAPTDAAGAPLDLIPKTAAEIREAATVAPGAVVWDGARHRALVFYTKLLRRDSEERRVGTSFALWANPDAGALRPRMRPGAGDPTMLFDADEPPWGSGALLVGNWLYAYGCDAEKNYIPRRCRLARVPIDRAADRDERRFYARGAWSPDWRHGTYVMDALPPMSVSWNDYLGKYVSVSPRYMSSLIRIQMADHPEGPWSDEIFVDAIPGDFGWTWIGWAAGHPEFSRDRGRVEMLTYTRGVGKAGNETRAIEIQFRKR